MTTRRVATFALLLVCASLCSVSSSGGAVGHPVPASATVVGNVTGPNVLAYHANETYSINASGGPAFSANGTLVGNLTYFASITGSNLTGVSITPSEGKFVGSLAQRTKLSVGNVSETLTVQVEITSVLQAANTSLNLTYAVTVVQPYVLTLHIVSDSSATVLAFPLTVDLDGTSVGAIQIPTLTAREAYTATFQYATLGLSAGDHTFTVSLANEHGLLTFAGGGTTYSASFYVEGPPPSYTLWYLAGAVAFFGAIFIFVTRVAARRRNPSRK